MSYKILKKYSSLIAVLFLFLICISAFGTPVKYKINEKRAGAVILPPPAPGWNLVWSDDFNGTSVDTTKWRVADRNRDTPNTTRYTPNNVSVANGSLILKVRDDQNYCIGTTCTNWSGGMVESYDASSSDSQKYRLFKYGYYEARIRYHLYGCGFWANFWMFARPQGPEEFDQEIMTCTGSTGTTSRANQIRPAYHYSGGTSFSWINAIYNDSWHTYGYLWLPGQPIRFFYDSQEIYSPPQLAHDKTMYINLRAGVGMKADTGGNPGPSTEFPGTAEYDYVKVYSYTGGSISQPPHSPTPSITINPGDVDGNGTVNIIDFQLLSNSFGKVTGQSGYDARADFDNSGSITILDFQTLSNNFGG